MEDIFSYPFSGYAITRSQWISTDAITLLASPSQAQLLKVFEYWIVYSRKTLNCHEMTSDAPSLLDNDCSDTSKFELGLGLSSGLGSGLGSGLE